MRTSLSLRQRVTLAWLLFGATLSAVLAVVAIAVNEDFEHLLIENLLRTQAADAMHRYTADPAIDLPHDEHAHAYVRAPGRNDIPAHFASLGPGFHEIEVPGHEETHVAVLDRDGVRLVYTLELPAIEQRERYAVTVLLVIIALGTTLSGWAGWAFAGRVIRPVGELSRRVDRLRSPHAPSLVEDFGDDEVGKLALAFDRYQQRLRDAMARERAFTADASHELRTPIAVIRGAVEVLADDPVLHDAARRRLQRVQRGVAELSDLLDALLLLARGSAESPAAAERVAWSEIFARLADGREPDWRAQHAVVTFDAPDDAGVRAPARVLEVILANVIRGYTQRGERAHVHVHADATELTVSIRADVDDATSPPAQPAWVATPASRRETGDRLASGIGMISRLCAQLGWHIAQETADDGRERLTIRFDAPTASSVS